MKKVSFIIAFMAATIAASAQSSSIKVTTSGGKSSVNANISVPQGQRFNLDKPKDEGTLTTNTADYKGTNYPVYVTAKGRLFIKLTSPTTGKEYRKYITPQVN